MNQLWQTAQSHVEARAAGLRALPYADLARLPEHSEDTAPGTSPRFQVSVWRTLLEDETVRIIVQASRHYFGGILSRSAVAGFDKRPNGEVADIPEGEFE